MAGAFQSSAVQRGAWQTSSTVIGAFQSGAFQRNAWQIGAVSSGNSSAAFTGGWGGFLLAYDREVLRKRKAAAAALEAELDAEDAAIAQLVPLAPLQTTEQTESGIALEALRQMVATAEANAAAMLESERVNRAFARAQAQMTAGALLALDRELTRLREEEEFAVLFALAMDD